MMWRVMEQWFLSQTEAQRPSLLHRVVTAVCWVLSKQWKHTAAIPTVIHKVKMMLDSIAYMLLNMQLTPCWFLFLQ